VPFGYVSLQLTLNRRAGMSYSPSAPSPVRILAELGGGGGSIVVGVASRVGSGVAAGVGVGVGVGVETAWDACATVAWVAIPAGVPAGVAAAQPDARSTTMDSAPEARQPSPVPRLVVRMPATSAVVRRSVSALLRAINQAPDAPRMSV
jgi:hypothetical protein